MTQALVIHPGALGDVLLAIPALRALRADGLAITLAAQPRIGALLVALHEVEHAMAFDTLGLDALFVDSPVDPDAPVVRRLAEPSRVVCWFGSREAGFVRRLRQIVPDAVIAPPASTRAPVWRHLLETIEMASRETRVRTPVAVSAALRARGADALRAAGWDGASRIVVVHPGAGGIAKRWPADGFADVIAGIDASIVVHQGPADAEAATALRSRARGRVITLVDPALPVLAGVLADACAYVGNDSGVSHLAAAVGTPSIVLFTEPALPWVPWSRAARCVIVTTASVVRAERDAVQAALRAIV